MRHETLLDLARRDDIRLPSALVDEWPPQLTAADEKGWFRFQRLYDLARSVLRTEDDVRRLVRELAEDDVRDGAVWTELQVDPSGYSARFGGITAFTDLVLDAITEAEHATGLGFGLVIAANRTRHPLDARTLARLAAQYAGHGVVGFGLSNDERRGSTEDFERAFAIARRADLTLAPHAGELRGAAQVRTTLDTLEPHRLGHGIRASEDPAILDRLAAAGIACEVCPASNVSLGVYDTYEEIPVRTLKEAGVLVSLGADDPLLFGSRLAAQYNLLRIAQDFSDTELADLARDSIHASRAPESIRVDALAGIDEWIATPAESTVR